MHKWQDGELITAQKLNALEEAVAGAATAEALDSAIKEELKNVGATQVGAVSYSEPQDLGDQNKRIALTNINAIGYLSQQLTPDQQDQARRNIGAISSAELGDDITSVGTNTQGTGTFPLIVANTDNITGPSNIKTLVANNSSNRPTVDLSTGIVNVKRINATERISGALYGDGSNITNLDLQYVKDNSILPVSHGGTGVDDLSRLKGQLGGVDPEVIAPDYDKTIANGFDENKYCTRNGKFYRSNKVIAKNADWNFDDWNEITLANLIQSLDQTVANVSYGVFTSTSDGLVPSSGANADNKFLKGDGTWGTPEQYTLPTASSDTLGGVKVGNGLTITDGVLSAKVQSVPGMTGATTSADGTGGLVPAPLTTDLGKFLSADGSWKEVVTDLTDVNSKIADAIKNIADEYDASKTYNVNDYCIYENKLYVCTQEATGEFDSEKWNEANVVEAISEISSKLTPEAIGAASASDLANEYNSATAYEVGDYCIYNGHLYKCKTNVTGTAPTNSTYWEATTIDEAMRLAAQAAAASASGVVRYDTEQTGLTTSEQAQARENIAAAASSDISTLNTSLSGLSTSVSNLSSAINNLNNTVNNVTRTKDADTLTISYNNNIPSTTVSIATEMPLKDITYSTETNRLYFWNREMDEPTSQDLEDTTKQVFDSVFIQGGGGGQSAIGTITITRITDYNITAVQGETVPISFSIAATDVSGDPIIATNPGDPIGTADWYIDNIPVVGNIDITSGDNSFDITPYLTAGFQEVKLKVSINTGGESLQTITKPWRVNLINMFFTWSYNDSQINTGAFTDSWISYGNIEKVAHTKLDTTELDTVTTSISGAQQTITIPAQTHGVHGLERWLTATVNGVEKRTASQYHEIIFVEVGNNTPIIAIGQQSTTMQQYDTLRIPYTVYDPLTSMAEVTLSIDNVVIAIDQIDRTTQYWSYTPAEAGEHTLTISCGSVSRTITITVTEVTLEDVSEKSGYDFKFKASDFATNSAVQNWNSNGITATYSDNFDWINGGLHTEEDENGNLQQYFCVRAGTTMTINYKLFGNAYDPKEFGKNFKFIFKAINCRTYDAEVLSCFADNIGLQLTANEGTLRTLNETLTTYYCKDSYIEFETNIHPNSEHPYLQFWIDGTPDCTVLYGSTDSMQQGQNTSANITIGSNNCDVYIYLIKAYPNYATNNEELSNFIMDAPNASQMVLRYNRNNILTDGEVDYNKLAAKNPDLRILLLDLEKMTGGKEDEDEVLAHTVRYIHRGGGDADCFIINNCGVKVQGTSSVGYLESAGNLDINFKYGRQVYNTNLTTGAIMFDDNHSSQNGYSMSPNSIPVDYMNVKVNVASSENANNACIADWYNEYQPWLSPARSKNSNARDTMEFVPGALFIKDRSGGLFSDTQKYHFYGICDIGNSKKNTKVFHDTTNPLACCVEVSNNTSLPCLMQQKTYEWNGKAAKIIEEGKSQTVFEFRYYDKPSISLVQAGWDRFVSFMYDNNPNLATNNNLSQPVTFAPYTFKGWGKYDTSAYDADNVIYLYGYGTPSYEASTYVTNTEAEKCYYYINYSNNYIYSSNGTAWSQTAELTWTLDSRNVLGGTTISTYAGTYNKDTFEYRMACLLEHCEEYLIMDPVIYHFIFIESFLMTDNVAKNTFWSSDDLVHWEPSKDYDNDTALGNDNVGGLSFTYGLETDDIIGSSYVFNAHSAAWITFARGLFDACQQMYRNRESAGCFNSKNFLAKVKNWQAARPERLWVADAQRKYLRPYEDNGTITYLPMLAGRKTHQREQVKVYNAYYYASKYVSTLCTGTNITVRGNTPTSGDTLIAVPPMNKATITMYINCYAVITSTSNNVVAKQRVTRGTPVEMDFTTIGNMTETELYFCSAEMITGLSGLAHLYFKQNDFNKASNLQYLEIGSNASKTINGHVYNYENQNLVALNIGDNNKMLERLDVRNCPNVTGELNLSKCISIKELYLDNTAFTGISIAPGGLLTTMSLEAPTSITLCDLLYLNNITIANPNNIATLRIENCIFDDAAELTINEVTTVQSEKDLVLALVESAPNLSRIRLLGMDWYTNTALLDRLYNMAGINDNLYDTAQSVITGKTGVRAASARQLSAYESAWPDFEITPDTTITEFIITFLNADGTPIKDKNNNNYVQYIAQGSEAYDPILANEVDTPLLAETAQYTYTFNSWNNLTGVVNSNKTVTATYTETVRTYTVRWYIDDKPDTTPLETIADVAYGSSVSYSETYPPIYSDEESSQHYYVFTGWDKSTSFITGDTNVYARWDDSVLPSPASAPELKDMSLSQIYGVTKTKANVITDASTGERAYWNIGDYYDINVGYDPNYSNVESITLINESKYFDGTNNSIMIFNGENNLPKIKLFDTDSPSFTLAIDYELTGTSDDDFISCSDSNNWNAAIGFGLKNHTIHWGNSTAIVGNGYNRNIIVLRHNKGENSINQLGIYFHNNTDNYSYTEVPTTLSRVTSSIANGYLTFGGIADSQGTAAGAQGWIHWSKIWYQDLGASDARAIARWPHETWRMEYNGIGKRITATSASETEFILKNPLPQKCSVSAPSTMTNFFDKIYNALPIGWRTIIKEVNVNTITGYNNNSISSPIVETTKNKIYLPALAEVSSEYSENDTYAVELSGSKNYSPIFVNDETRIKFPNIINSFKNIIRRPYENQDPTNYTTENPVYNDGQTLWIRTDEIDAPDIAGYESDWKIRNVGYVYYSKKYCDEHKIICGVNITNESSTKIIPATGSGYTGGVWVMAAPWTLRTGCLNYSYNTVYYDWIRPNGDEFDTNAWWTGSGSTNPVNPVFAFSI